MHFGDEAEGRKRSASCVLRLIPAAPARCTKRKGNHVTRLRATLAKVKGQSCCSSARSQGSVDGAGQRRILSILHRGRSAAAMPNLILVELHTHLVPTVMGIDPRHISTGAAL
jgi:hypothetical protein